MSYTLINTEWTTKMEYTGTNVTYVGEAQPGSSTSAAVWRIKKLTYNSNSMVTDIKWAGGTSAFNKVWDSRASYTYS